MMRAFPAIPALTDGVGRVRRAPVLLLAVWLITLLCSVPLAIGVRADIERQLGASAQAAEVVRGASYDWLTAFSDQASGASATVGPAVIGFSAVVDNLGAFLDLSLRPAVIAAAGAVYVLAWTFLAGGLLDRLARDRALRAHTFFQACGGYFFRLLRLSLLAGVFYGLVLGRLHPWLFGTLFERWTSGLASERTTDLVRFGLYFVFLVALGLVNLCFDYAKIRLVVEDRVSAIGALGAAGRFIRRHPLATCTLYLADLVLFLAVIALYGLYGVVGPVAAGGAVGDWFVFAVGQLYIAARLAVKLVFWASETALFQGQFAHAGYTARRLPAWPDSAAAEALDSGYTLASISPPSEAP